MFKSQLRKISTLTLAFVMTAALIGCGAKQEESKQTPNTQTNEISGTIQIAGSTSVQPLSEELAMEFMNKNKNVKINVAGGGSSAGIKAATEGTADIGASSRELKTEEKKVKEFVIALDGIAVIVHKDNKIADLKKEDIQKIFAGQITDWSEVGGEPGKIQVVTREEGSGTRGAFEEIVLGKEKMFEKAIVQNSTGAVRTAVVGDKNAMGYISLGSLNADVKAVKVDGTEASEANIKSGTYKVARPFVYLTKTEPEDAAKAFIDWVLSTEGQEIVKELSFITVK